MSNEELSVLLAEWQKRLRLQDWNVKVKLCRAHEVDTEDARGTVHPYNNEKAAFIQVVVASDQPSECTRDYDEEETLVHELIHLLFEPFWRAKKEREQEQAIHALAGALIAAKREGLHSEPPNGV